MNEHFWQFVAVAGLTLLLTIVILLVISIRKSSRAAPKPIESPLAPTRPQYSDDDTISAYNAVIDARNELVELTSLPDNDTRGGDTFLESMAFTCASQAQKLRIATTPLTHPHITGIIPQYIEVYEAFHEVAGEWTALSKESEATYADSGYLDYLIKFAVDFASGDPLRQSRELEEKSRNLSVAESQLIARTNGIWARFHALNEIFDQRGDALSKEYGWNKED